MIRVVKRYKEAFTLRVKLIFSIPLQLKWVPNRFWFEQDLLKNFFQILKWLWRNPFIN